MSRSRIPLLVMLLALAVTALAACGSGDAAPATTTASTAAFPVEIQNQRGDVEIPAQPRRVVALDFDSADAAIALGVVPVGMAEVDYVPGKVQPWTRAALDGAEPELFPYVDGPPLERIAALRPDVILAANTYGLDAQWEKLNRIAPVVAAKGAEGTDRWELVTERVGAALGRSAQAARLVAETNTRVAAARSANPAFDGATIAFFNLYESDAWAITGGDASITFLKQLGFELSPQIAKLRGQDGRVAISPERFALLDADVLMGTSSAGDVSDELGDVATFQRLPVVRRGAFVGLGLVGATSMAFPSALSVDYGLDEIVPQLARAATAG
jgi:iron complex transport system substrate-binding protein